MSAVVRAREGPGASKKWSSGVADSVPVTTAYTPKSTKSNYDLGMSRLQQAPVWSI